MSGQFHREREEKIEKVVRLLVTAPCDDRPGRRALCNIDSQEYFNSNWRVLDN
jgi:hypothetical protein